MTALIEAPIASDHTPGLGAIETGDGLVEAVERQSAAALSAVRAHDPQTWLFLERARYLAQGTCDPFAEQMLRRAGFLPMP